MKKKFLLIIMVIFLTCIICSCKKQEVTDVSEPNSIEKQTQLNNENKSNENPQKSKENNITESNNKDSLNDSNNKDLEILIKNGRVLINELNFDKEQKGNLGPLKYWLKPLGLSSYSSNGTMANTIPLDRTANPVAQLNYCYGSNPKYLKFSWQANNDFSNIDTKEILMSIKGIYGIDLDEREFNEIFNNYTEKVFELKKETAETTILYDKDDIYIVLFAAYDGEKRSILLSSSYKNKK